MAKKKKNKVEEPKSETRKQTRVRLRDQARNRKLMLYVGSAVGVALILVIIGIVSETIIRPRSVLASVEGRPIVTQDFWERTKLRKSELENQLQQYQLFAAQFGEQGQSLFASQIAQLEATLSSPLSLGTQVINQMINDEIVQIKAAERGITVSDEEVDASLREEVAAGQGAVTVPQATATAEAAVAATATAELFTPTPEPELPAVITDTLEITDSATITEPATVVETAEVPTPEPPAILTDALYQEGLATLGDNLRQIAGVSIDEYREIVRVQLLTDKLSEQVGEELIPATEEQVNVRHILITVDQTTPISDTEGVTDTAEISGTALITDPVTGFYLPPFAGLNDAGALALTQQLRQRILDGEDFATLATEYSQDPGSGADGGDLGWVGRGVFVTEFEDAAFSLPIGEVSEPVQTQFGYHPIETLERDENRAKDEAQLQQERAQAFQQWLQEQSLELNVERPSDLPSALPTGL
ncbi:MAG: peptidylprolyl isomerase [Caldilineaceae bacterium]